MSFSNWSRDNKIVIAFILVAVVGAIISAVVYREYHVGRNAYREYQRETQADQREAADEIAKRCATYGPPSKAIRHCIAEAVRAYQSEANTSQDLQAQKDMAYWGMAMFFASGASLLISLVGLVALIDSLNQTRTAIRNDREIGEAQARAYLNVSHAVMVKVDTPAIFPHLDGINAKVVFVNSGQSPAHNIHLRRKERTIGAAVRDFDRGLSDVEFTHLGTIGANASFSYSIENIIEDEAYRALISKTCYSFFFGELVYKDVFGVWWSARHCLRVEGFGTSRVKVFPYGYGNKTIRLKKGEYPDEWDNT